MTTYEIDLYEWRQGDPERLDGISKWFWLKYDEGAWYGCNHDWPQQKQDILNNVKNFDVVVQAGGCMGMYPRLLSNMFKTVYTFEMLSVNFYALAQNCNKSNIIKINAALGDRHAMITPYDFNHENVGMNGVFSDSVEGAFIPQLMIDDLALSACDLIMIDVEGYELNVLRGAINTINKFKPVIFAERAEFCIDFMKELGYYPAGKSHLDLIFLPEK